MKLEEYLTNAAILNVPRTPEYFNKFLTPEKEKKIIQHATENGIEPRALASFYLKESSWGMNKTDYEDEITKSVGDLQINIKANLDVSEEQANDLDFSLDWTAKKIKEAYDLGYDIQKAYQYWRTPGDVERPKSVKEAKKVLEYYNAFTEELPAGRKERLDVIYQERPDLKLEPKEEKYKVPSFLGEEQKPSFKLPFVKEAKALSLDKYLEEPAAPEEPKAVSLDEYLGKEEKVKSTAVAHIIDFFKGAYASLLAMPQTGAQIVKEPAELSKTEEGKLLADIPSIINLPGFNLIRSFTKVPEYADETIKAADEVIAKNKKWILDKNLVYKGADKSRQIASELGQGGGSIALALGTTLLTRSPSTAVALFGAMAKANHLAEREAMGVDPSFKGKLISDAVGVTEGALEYIGLKYWFKGAGGKVVNTLVRSLVEATQEFSQSVGGNFWAKVDFDPDRPLFQGAVKSGIYGALLSVPFGVMMPDIDFNSIQKDLVSQGLSEDEAKKVIDDTVKQSRTLASKWIDTGSFMGMINKIGGEALGKLGEEKGAFIKPDEFVPKEKPEEGEVIFHQSTKKGVPTFDAFFGTEKFQKDFPEEFGKEITKLTLPKDIKILDLNVDSKEAREFMSQVALNEFPTDKEYSEKILAGDKIAIEEFYDIWTGKEPILLELKEIDYEGIRFREEILLTKETIATLKAVKPEAKLEAKPIPKEPQPLAVEAKKFKSAEEFVKAQVPKGEQIFFHGTTEAGAENIDKVGFILTKGGFNKGRGISISKDFDTSSAFSESGVIGKPKLKTSGKVFAIKIKENAKIVDMQDWLDLRNSIKENINLSLNELNIGAKDLGLITSEELSLSDITKLKFRKANQLADEEFIKKGVDIINDSKRAYTTGADQSEFLVLNPKVIEIIKKIEPKSQLTDFYNQAVKEKEPEVKPEKKPAKVEKEKPKEIVWSKDMDAWYPSEKADVAIHIMGPNVTAENKYIVRFVNEKTQETLADSASTIAEAKKIFTELKIKLEAVKEPTPIPVDKKPTDEDVVTDEEKEAADREKYEKAAFEEMAFEDRTFPETDKENHYQDFVNIFSKPGVAFQKERLSSGDLEVFVKTLKTNQSIKADAEKLGMGVDAYLHGLFYSQEQSGDEVFDEFKDRLASENPGLLYGVKVAEQLGLKGIIKTEAKDTRDTKQVRALPDRLKDIITFTILPAIKQKARLFGLLGNKLTSIPIFREVFDKWAKDGVHTIVEAYGGAFTLVPHALDKSVKNGLKTFYSNIFDAEKFMIVKLIKNGGVNRVKASYERNIRKLDDAIITKAQELGDASVLKTLEDFKIKFPDKIVGSAEWYTWVRNETPVGARVMSLKDEYDAWREVFQGAINEVYTTDIKTLDEATMKSLINRIGVYNDKGQKFIGQAGFRRTTGAIYDKQGIFNALEMIAERFKWLKKEGVNVKLLNRDGAELVQSLKFEDPSKVGWVFDPPYKATAKTYKNLENVENFLTGKGFVEAHKKAFDGKGKVAITNDVDTEWIDSLMGAMPESTIFAYKEGATPTSLILSEDMTGDILDMIERRKIVGSTRVENFVFKFEKALDDLKNGVKRNYTFPAIIKASSEKNGDVIPDDQFYDYEVLYAKDRLKKQKGNVKDIIGVLSKAGVRDEVIDILTVNEVYLKDIVKIKREKTGEQVIISKKVLKYIKDTSNIENIGEAEMSKWLTPVKDTLKWAVAGYEVPARMFRRFGMGFSKIINDSVREGERSSVSKRDWIKTQLPSFYKVKDERLTEEQIAERKEIKRLSKKERIRINAAFMNLQGVQDIPAELLTPLTKRENKGFKELTNLFNTLYLEVKKVAFKMGIQLHQIENYSPLYLSSDVKILQFGSLYEIVRKDPYFKSTKERTGPTKYKFYEKDIGKIMDVWISNAARYIEMSEVTNKVKFLIESDEFKALVTPEIHTKITEWYKYTVNTPDLGKGGRALRWLRGRTATYILGLRYTVPAKQFLNLLDLWVKVGTVDMLKGAVELKRNKQLAKYVKNSPAVVERDIIDITMMGVNDVVFNFMKKPTIYTDQLTAKLSKIIVMRKLMDRHMVEGDKMNWKLWKDIDRFSNDMVDNIMGALAKSQAPAHFRTEAGKNWNMFMSQLTAKAGYHVQDVWMHQNPEMWKQLPQSRKSAIIKSSVALILTALLEQFITNLSFPDDPEEIAKETLTTLIGNFPTLGGVTYSFMSGQSYSPMPVLGIVSKLIDEGNLIKDSVKTETKIKHLKRFVWYLTGLVGVPRQLRLTSEGVEGTIQGYVEVGGKKIYLEGIEKWLLPLKGKYGSQKAKDVFRKKKGGGSGIKVGGVKI